MFSILDFQPILPTYFQKQSAWRRLTNISPFWRPFWRCFCWCQGGNNLLVPGRVHAAGWPTVGIASRIRKGRHGSRWEFGGGHRGGTKPKKRWGGWGVIMWHLIGSWEQKTNTNYIKWTFQTLEVAKIKTVFTWNVQAYSWLMLMKWRSDVHGLWSWNMTRFARNVPRYLSTPSKKRVDTIIILSRKFWWGPPEIRLLEGWPSKIKVVWTSWTYIYISMGYKCVRVCLIQLVIIKS